MKGRTGNGKEGPPLRAGLSHFWIYLTKEEKHIFYSLPRWSRGKAPHLEEWWGIRRLIRRMTIHGTQKSPRKWKLGTRPRQHGSEETLRRWHHLREAAPGPRRRDHWSHRRAVQGLPRCYGHENLPEVRWLAPPRQVVDHRRDIPGNCLTSLPHHKSK